MLKNLFNSTGAEQKPKTSFIYNNKLYFSSITNILTVDLSNLNDYKNKKSKTECFIKNFKIKFIKRFGTSFILASTCGNFYLQDIDNLNDEPVFIFKSESFICDFDFCDKENVLVSTDLDKVYLKKLGDDELKTIKFQNCTAVKIFKSFLILGNIKGELFINKIGEEQIIKFADQSGEISGLDLCVFEEKVYFLSFSFDETVKFWGFDEKIFEKEKSNSINYLKTFSDFTMPISTAKFVLNSTENNYDVLISCLDGSLTLIKNILSSENTETQKFGNILGTNKSFYDIHTFNNKIIGQMKGAFVLFDEEKMINIISGHTGPIVGVDVKVDKKTNTTEILTSSSDFTARIFEDKLLENSILNFNETSRPIIHGYELNCCKFQDELIICASEENLIRIFEPTNFSQCLRNKTMDKEIDCCTSAELSLTNQIVDEKNFSDNLINEKNLGEFSVFYEKEIVSEHFFEIKEIEVGEKNILVSNKSSCKKFAYLTVYNKNMEKIKTIEDCNLTVNKIKASGCGKYFLTVSRDKSSSIICADKLEVISKQRDHLREVYSCGFSLDSKYFATCGRDGLVCFYETEKTLNGFIKKPEKESQCCQKQNLETEKTDCIKLNLNKSVNSVVFTENKLIAGCSDGNLFVFDLEKILAGEKTAEHSQNIHGMAINDIKYNKANKTIITVGGDNLLRCFELK